MPTLKCVALFTVLQICETVGIGGSVRIYPWRQRSESFHEQLGLREKDDDGSYDNDDGQTIKLHFLGINCAIIHSLLSFPWFLFVKLQFVLSTQMVLFI
jgi:hypothetical protein